MTQPPLDYWNAAASWWANHLRSDPNRQLEVFPRLLAMLDLHPGLTVLDVGAGEGGLARRIARHGAIVTAIEGSALYDSAFEAERERPLGIHYRHLALDEAPSVLDACFDRVVASLVLHSCPDLDTAAASIRRLCAVGAVVAVCELNPDVVAPGSAALSSWAPYPDPSVRGYLVKIAPDAPPVPFFHRSASEYISTFGFNGLDLIYSQPSIVAVHEGRPLFTFWSFRCVSQ